MRNGLGTLVLAAALVAPPAAAVHTDQYQIPYFGLASAHVGTDTARDSDEALGFQVTFGVPLESAVNAVELRFFDAAMTRRDGKDDYQTGLMVDYVREFGSFGGPADGRAFRGIKPFVSLGVGFVDEDVRGEKHLHLAANLGGGVLIPIGFKGWALRFDARVQPQSNSHSAPGESLLIDTVINLGLQLPMTLFFDRPAVLGPAEECPVAVVDPESGRRDCAADSDGDGVGDRVDACPGTRGGTVVDARGCARPHAPTEEKRKDDSKDDVDGDSVADAVDACPGTQSGLQVDERGCVVAQKTSVQGVTFLESSAQLTEQGRQTLDGVAETLKAQENLKIEIAGHTDSVGSEAFNTLLSQQRADAVRAYLIEKGIDERRVTAVGYGELEPIDTDDTEEGRSANRRVEFRITTE